MNAADRAALLLLTRLRRDPTALSRLFAVIRRHDDAVLLAALGEKTRNKAGATSLSGALLADVRACLAPLLASAQEKADALAAALAAGTGEQAQSARGLAAMVRALERRYGADVVRSGAVRMMADIAAAAGRDAPP